MLCKKCGTEIEDGDYSQIGAHIMFSIFDNRIEIVSPGGLLPGLKINDLKGKHKARNHLICSIFH